MALVSVVIPAYNRETMIIDAVDSVLGQTFSDLEIIVVDDGSKDATAKVVEEKYGHRVKCIRQENKGLPGARNTGILAASGSFIALLDSDDMYCPTFLEEAMAFFKDKPELSVVFADTEKFDDGGVFMKSFFAGKSIEGIPFEESAGRWRVFTRSIYNDLIPGNFIPCSAVVVRAECFREAGMFNEKFRFCEDIDMWLRLASRYRLGYVNLPLGRVRVHGSNMTSAQFSEQYYRFRILVTESLLEAEPAKDAETRRIILETLGDLHWSLGWRYFSTLDLGKARPQFRGCLSRGGFDAKITAYWLATFLPAPMIRGIRRLKGSEAPAASAAPGKGT